MGVAGGHSGHGGRRMDEGMMDLDSVVGRCTVGVSSRIETAIMTGGLEGKLLQYLRWEVGE